MEQKPQGGWKIVAGGLALFVAYSVGYESGAKKNQPYVEPSNYAAFADPASDIIAIDATASRGPTDGAEQPEDASSPEPDLDALKENLAAGEARSAAVPALTAPITAPASALPLELASANDDKADAETPQEEDDSLASTSSIPTITPVASAPVGLSGYSAPRPPAYGCGENGSCYGDISNATGRPKTVFVHSYTRSDGTYVRSHYRSH